jgi:hypothetical protein
MVEVIAIASTRAPARGARLKRIARWTTRISFMIVASSLRRLEAEEETYVVQFGKQET